jgi:hypothetical protein
MSSELLAAVLSAHDDLPMITDVLMQWVLHGYLIMEIIPGHQVHVCHATTGTGPSAASLHVYLPGLVEDILRKIRSGIF